MNSRFHRPPPPQFFLGVREQTAWKMVILDDGATLPQNAQSFRRARYAKEEAHLVESDSLHIVSAKARDEQIGTLETLQ